MGIRELVYARFPGKIGMGELVYAHFPGETVRRELSNELFCAQRGTS